MPRGHRTVSDLSHDNLLWLAGLLEGEGAFLKGAPSSPRRPQISVEMTDEDVVAHVAAVLGVTYFSVAPRRQPWKPSYRLAIRGAPAVRVMQAIRPFMGARRQLQIDKAVGCAAPVFHRITVEKQGQIVSLLNTGQSHRQIAKLVSVSSTTVDRIARSATPM
jgi:hypothetical protein